MPRVKQAKESLKESKAVLGQFRETASVWGRDLGNDTVGKNLLSQVLRTCGEVEGTLSSGADHRDPSVMLGLQLCAALLDAYEAREEYEIRMGRR